MVGTLAQLIVMVGYGNQCISNRRGHPDFFQQNSTFQYCNQVFFTAEKRKNFFSLSKLTTIAENSLEWYTYLSCEGCQALRLYYEGSESGSNNADHRMAGMIYQTFQQGVNQTIHCRNVEGVDASTLVFDYDCWVKLLNSPYRQSVLTLVNNMQSLKNSDNQQRVFLRLERNLWRDANKAYFDIIGKIRDL